MSNNPDKAAQLAAGGLVVEDQVRTGVHLSPVNGAYLAAKVRRGQHWGPAPARG